LSGREGKYVFHGKKLLRRRWCNQIPSRDLQPLKRARKLDPETLGWGEGWLFFTGGKRGVLMRSKTSKVLQFLGCRTYATRENSFVDREATLGKKRSSQSVLRLLLGVMAVFTERGGMIGRESTD